MTKLKQTLEKVLKSEPTFFDSESGELNYTKVKDSADKIDAKLISLLADNKDLKNKFFTKIKDVYVFNIQDFKFFLDESKVDNSYTQYANKIGLADNSGLLENRSEVVLDFPFKDCVLEGGQSTEEGTDTYFEFSDKTGKYEEKNGKRNEVFFNQVLAHDEIDRLFDRKALVNWKRFTKDSKKDGEAVKEIKRDKTGLIQENLIIKGNNLLALHSLKSEFAGKIKLIYIDPPYNTGNDEFKYNDNFNHSTWLTFMKNRLEVAKDLLTEDGVILVQCDDKEQAYLKVLMDSIDSLRFKNSISVEMSPSSGVKRAHKDKQLIKNKEFILFYTKSESLKIYPIYDEWESYDTHYSIFFDSKNIESVNNKISKKFPEYKNVTLDKAIYFNDIYKFLVENSNNIYRTHQCSKWAIESKKDRDLIYKSDSKKIYKVFNPNDKNEFELLISIKRKDGTIGYDRLEPLSWNINDNKISTLRGDLWLNFDKDIGNVSKEGRVALKNGKKPERLIYDIIRLITKENDIILDYHLGSGTTCAVAHKMNRQYIGIEQLDYEENDSVKRLQNVIKGDESGISKDVNWKGGGNFIYCELAKWNEKAKEEIQNAKDLPALIKLFDTLREKYFLNYNVKIKDFKEKIIKEENFKKLTLTQQKKMFLTMLDLNQMYVNESEMADKKYGISTEDQKLTKAFYSKK